MARSDSVKPQSSGEIDAKDYLVGENNNPNVSRYFSDIRPIKVLTAKQEKLLFKRYSSGSENAYNKLIGHNLKLVVKFAKRYRPKTNLPFLDLIQEGNLGLMHAIKKFDIEKGIRFSTYAAYWIKQAIDRAIIYQNDDVRVPVHIAR